MNSKPSVGIALGSGGPRGFAHIGVLKAIEDNNIDIDYVSGSSAGALVGGIYCCGVRPQTIRDIAIQIDRKFWVDFTVPRRGLIKGDRIEEALKILTGNRNIEDLGKKLSIVATDLKASQRYVFEYGLVYKAIRASISIPGVFVPVRTKNMVLVDGGVIDRVPVSIIKDMGAEIIIAVNVGFSTQLGRINHIIDVIMQSIDVMGRQILESNMIDADVIIEPELSHINSTKFNQVEECFNIGYKAAIDKMDEIKKVIKEKKNIKANNA